MGQTIKSRKSFEFFFFSQLQQNEFRPHNINISLDIHHSRYQVSSLKMVEKKNFRHNINI